MMSRSGFSAGSLSPRRTRAPDLGELTSTTAAEGSLVVSLTRGETRLAYQALSLTLLGPYAVLESEYHTPLGFEPITPKRSSTRSGARSTRRLHRPPADHNHRALERP